MKSYVVLLATGESVAVQAVGFEYKQDDVSGDSRICFTSEDMRENVAEFYSTHVAGVWLASAGKRSGRLP